MALIFACYQSHHFAKPYDKPSGGESLWPDLVIFKKPRHFNDVTQVSIQAISSLVAIALRAACLDSRWWVSLELLRLCLDSRTDGGLLCILSD